MTKDDLRSVLAGMRGVFRVALSDDNGTITRFSSIRPPVYLAAVCRGGRAHKTGESVVSSS